MGHRRSPKEILSQMITIASDLGFGDQLEEVFQTEYPDTGVRGWR